jgi:hypothetical protein
MGDLLNALFCIFDFDERKKSLGDCLYKNIYRTRLVVPQSELKEVSDENKGEGCFAYSSSRWTLVRSRSAYI